MKIATIIGARPQFIKAASVSRAIRNYPANPPRNFPPKEIILHTGQHYDDEMSAVFFRELEIPQPDYNLGIGSGAHGFQTAEMLKGIEQILLSERPDWVIVYGDTNSTLAGALAAAKLNMALAHVEAGLRSFNRRMPEEINRVMTDHLCDVLFCPSTTATENLAREGISKEVHLIGDVMADSLSVAASRASVHSRILQDLQVTERGFLLATVHRAENTDNPQRLTNILRALDQLQEKTVFPVHPRTLKRIKEIGFTPASHIQMIDPVGYLDMVMLEKSARLILTDSGGVQKEAYWLAVPCVTVRDETEWVETVTAGWNRVAGTETQKIVAAVQTFVLPSDHPELYGNTGAAKRILEVLMADFSSRRETPAQDPGPARE